MVIQSILSVLMLASPFAEAKIKLPASLFVDIDKAIQVQIDCRDIILGKKPFTTGQLRELRSGRVQLDIVKRKALIDDLVSTYSGLVKAALLRWVNAGDMSAQLEVRSFFRKLDINLADPEISFFSLKPTLAQVKKFNETIHSIPERYVHEDAETSKLYEGYLEWMYFYFSNAVTDYSDYEELKKLRTYSKSEYAEIRRRHVEPALKRRDELVEKRAAVIDHAVEQAPTVVGQARFYRAVLTDLRDSETSFLNLEPSVYDVLAFINLLDDFLVLDLPRGFHTPEAKADYYDILQLLYAYAGAVARGPEAEAYRNHPAYPGAEFQELKARYSPR